MRFYKVSSPDIVAKHLAQTLKERLKGNQKVTWFVTGGSAIAVAVHASKKLHRANLSNLLVTLTDERFVPQDSPGSNWKQLQEGGMDLPGAQLFPVLNHEDIDKTKARYADILKKLLDEADYKIGLFGMGPDGHIAALFPGFPQVNENGHYAAHLNNSPKPPPERLTMTPAAIKQLDEAVVFAKGPEKKAALENLNRNLTLDDQPAQILKTLPKLTIYNDQIGEEI